MEPWKQPNDYGEWPGGICCQRSTGGRCFEHNPANCADVQRRIAADHEAREESRVETLRRSIVEQYAAHPTGTGSSFGEILCHEIHENGLTFEWLARKWGLSLATLGELIADHCRRLEAMPVVDHEWRRE